MKKRIITTLLCVVMVLGLLTIPASARWTNCASISLGMSRTNGTISWSGNIVGYSDTIEITADYVLEKLGSNGKYTLVDSWTGLSTTRTSLNSSDSAPNTSSGTYRLSLSGTVKSAGYTEPITASITKTF